MERNEMYQIKQINEYVLEKYFNIFYYYSMNQRLGNGQLFSSNMAFSNKFNACKIQRNKLNSECYLNQEKQYIFQQSLRQPERKNVTDKQNIQPIKERQHQKELVPKTLGYEANSNLNDEQNKLQQQKEESELMQLWKKMENQQSSELATTLQEKKQKVKKNQQTFQQKMLSNSSCELSPEQLEKWLSQCNANQEQNSLPNQSSNNQMNGQICPISTQQNQQKQNNEAEEENWGSWAQIVDQLENNSSPKNQYKNQSLAPLANNVDARDNEQEFVILDTPTPQNQIFITPRCWKQGTEQPHQQFCTGDENINIGPWKFDLPQSILTNNQPVYIHKLNANLNTSQKTLSQVERELMPLRKINWEILEERKPEIINLRSKRYCRTTLLQYGKDFFIYDYLMFAVSPLRENSHTYFGVKTQSITGQFTDKKIKNKLNAQKNYIKDYLYLPGNGQCLLQTCYPDIQQSLKERKVKKFSIHLSLTKQKVAVCQRFIVNDTKQKKEIIEIKAYDQFQESEAQYLGLIETKISNFSEQWYCDTIINIPRKKTYSNKINVKNWQQLKIQLRLSETGTIVAELGIFDADSSVTNCILFGQNKGMQFMMGSVAETDNEIDYIVRITSISPIVGFVTLLSRQIFVLSQ